MLPSAIKVFCKYCAVVFALIAIYVWNSDDSNPAQNYRPVDEKLKMEAKLSAFVLGATGEVGKAIVKELVKHTSFEKVTLIGRRKLDLPSAEEDANYGKIDQQIVDFEKLSEFADVFKGHEVGYSTLGTTRGKAGPAAFYRVDHDYVVESATLAKEAGCRHFHLVSSTSANKNSLFLYPRTKGEVEAEISAMGFERLSIYRPALLLVDRQESRFGEAFFRAVIKPIDVKRWMSIDVPVLAKVMVDNQFRPPTPEKNVEIFTNSDMIKMSKEK